MTSAMTKARGAIHSDGFTREKRRRGESNSAFLDIVCKSAKHTYCVRVNYKHKTGTVDLTDILTRNVLCRRYTRIVSDNSGGSLYRWWWSCASRSH